MKDFFLRGFDYDLWANRAWLPFVASAPEPAPLIEVIEHVAWASGIWLGRCGLPNDAPSEDLLARFERQHASWSRLVEEDDLDRIVPYRNLSGVPFERPLSDIIWHVLNHGTYHRGQLRGLIETQGVGTWPETDVVRFCDE